MANWGIQSTGTYIKSVTIVRCVFLNGGHNILVGLVGHNNPAPSPRRKRFLDQDSNELLWNQFSWPRAGSLAVETWRTGLGLAPAPNCLGGKGGNIVVPGTNSLWCSCLGYGQQGRSVLHVLHLACSLWMEGGNPHRHGENMQTPHRKTVLITEPPWHPTLKRFYNASNILKYVGIAIHPPIFFTL